MSEKPKIFVKPNGSIRVTGEVDFIDSEGKVGKSNGRYQHANAKPLERIRSL